MADEESKPSARKTGRPAKLPLKCPKCSRRFALARERGAHLWHAHGVHGTSYSVLHKRAKAAKQIDERRLPVNGQSPSTTYEPEIDELSFVIGDACATVRNHITLIAERSQISEPLLRARVIAFLTGSQIRRKPGRPKSV